MCTSFYYRHHSYLKYSIKEIYERRRTSKLPPSDKKETSNQIAFFIDREDYNGCVDRLDAILAL